MLEYEQEFNPAEEYVEFPNGPPDDLKVEIKPETVEEPAAAATTAVTE